MADIDIAEFMTEATRDYIVQLLNEKALVDALVQPRIQQLIAAGDIVPRSRLQLGTGLELGPVGLEQAARALVAATADAEMPAIDGFAEALTALVAVLERVDAPALPESAPDEAAPEAAPDEPPPVEEPRCEVCNIIITEDQKLASKTRWRKILCAEHHATYDPKNPPAKYDATKARKQKAS